MSDRTFAVPAVLTIIWVSLWIISYDNIWLKIPIVADMFPLPLPNANLSYSDFITSIGIIGTLLLAIWLGIVASKEAQQQTRGFHRN